MGLITEDLAKTRAFQKLIELKENELEKWENQYENEMVKVQAQKILDDIRMHGEYNIFAGVQSGESDIETIKENIEMTKKEIIEINKFFNKYIEEQKNPLVEKIINEQK